MLDSATLLASLTGIGGNQIDNAMGEMLKAKAVESRVIAFKGIADLGSAVSEADKQWILTGK